MTAVLPNKLYLSPLLVGRTGFFMPNRRRKLKFHMFDNANVILKIAIFKN